MNGKLLVFTVKSFLERNTRKLLLIGFTIFMVSLIFYLAGVLWPSVHTTTTVTIIDSSGVHIQSNVPITVPDPIADVLFRIGDILLVSSFGLGGVALYMKSRLEMRQA